MKIRLMNGSCSVQREPGDALYALTQYGEQRFYARIQSILADRRPLEWAPPFVCRKATEGEAAKWGCLIGLFRSPRPGEVCAIFFQGGLAVEQLMHRGRVRLTVIRSPRRSRCRKS